MRPMHMHHAQDGELEAGEMDPKAAEAAAAAEVEARAVLGMDNELIEEMACEEMCNVAEQAAEAARACAASSRIGKRVCELGSGGWGVLCDCAQVRSHAHAPCVPCTCTCTMRRVGRAVRLRTGALPLHPLARP